MSSYPLRCGRLGKHEAHEWTHVRTYHCSGQVVIEGGWRAQDDADDAAEERAIRERREIA